jgi:hypothetical protein
MQFIPNQGSKILLSGGNKIGKRNNEWKICTGSQELECVE